MNFVDDFKSIAAFAVHFVTKCQDRQVAQAAHLKQFAGLGFHAFGAVNDHDGGVHGREGAVGVFGKIRVARCVDKIVAEVFVIKRHCRCGYGNSAVLFHLHKV